MTLHHRFHLDSTNCSLTRFLKEEEYNSSICGLDSSLSVEEKSCCCCCRGRLKILKKKNKKKKCKDIVYAQQQEIY